MVMKKLVQGSQFLRRLKRTCIVQKDVCRCRRCFPWAFMYDRASVAQILSRARDASG